MDAALLAAVIASAATLVGFLLNQAGQRRERRAKTYADALAALRRWQEVPYAIARRPASDSLTRSALGKEISDAVSGVAYHASLLRLESEPLGESYVLLWRQLRRSRAQNRETAWKLPIIASDAEMAPDLPFVPEDADPEYDLCLLAMRRELTLWGWILRRDTSRQIKVQRISRGHGLPSTPIR